MPTDDTLEIRLGERQGERSERSSETKRGKEIDHPPHYGGDTTYEAIKVIEAWGLDFSLGNALKYICRHQAAGLNSIEDLKKAEWYIHHRIEQLEKP